MSGLTEKMPQIRKILNGTRWGLVLFKWYYYIVFLFMDNGIFVLTLVLKNLSKTRVVFRITKNVDKLWRSSTISVFVLN